MEQENISMQRLHTVTGLAVAVQQGVAAFGSKQSLLDKCDHSVLCCWAKPLPPGPPCHDSRWVTDSVS